MPLRPAKRGPRRRERLGGWPHVLVESVGRSKPCHQAWRPECRCAANLLVRALDRTVMELHLQMRDGDTVAVFQQALLVIAQRHAIDGGAVFLLPKSRTQQLPSSLIRTSA